MDAIEYPYWENAARYTEDWLALLLALTLLFIAFPVVCGVIYLIKIIRFLIKRGKRTAKRALEKRDQRKYDKYMLEHFDNIFDNDHESTDDHDAYDFEEILEQDQKQDDSNTAYSVDEIIREINGD